MNKSLLSTISSVITRIVILVWKWSALVSSTSNSPTQTISASFRNKCPSFQLKQNEKVT